MRAYDVNLASDPRRARVFRKVDLLSADPLWSRVAVFYYSAAQIARKKGEINRSSAPCWEHGVRRMLAGFRIMEVMLACTCTVLRKLAVSVRESLRRHPKSEDVQVTR